MRRELLAVPVAALFLSLEAPRESALTPPLSAISFMSGCWTGPSPSGATIEEHYTAPSENLLIGMTRYVRNGRVVDFEFTTVERTDSTFVMTPRPKGVKSDSFPLKEVSDGRATWRTRSTISRSGSFIGAGPDGSPIARIEGTTPKGERHVEWTMHLMVVGVAGYASAVTRGAPVQRTGPFAGDRRGRRRGELSEGQEVRARSA
jgi:hypothetical protein